MNPHPKSIPIQRYIGIDIHKHYLMIGGQNTRREWTLRPRKVPFSHSQTLSIRSIPVDIGMVETTLYQSVN